MAGLLLLVTAAIILCSPQAALAQTGGAGSQPSIDDVPPEVLASVAARCSGCHVVPPPASIPRPSWRRIIDEMAQLMVLANVGMPADEQANILRFYEMFAPATMPAVEVDYAETGLSFKRQSVGTPPQRERPTVTHVKVTDLDGDGRQDVVVCDNDNSQVSWLRYLDDGSWQETVLASVDAPVHCEIFDREGDGDMDIIVASMGYMHPNDKLIGAAVLLENDGQETFTARELVSGTPRISDVQPADLDNDGDYDYLLAMFGWRTTGGLAWLETLSGDLPPQLHPIASANGAMLIEPVDFDGDGLMDFVSLITQQHETLVAYRNRQVAFLPEVIAQAPHPAFGSSGFQLVDLDGDGDLDVVFSNGDYMDTDNSTKYYHGVRWMENDGSFKFTTHEIATLPGCYRATAYDLDGDGDLDIVASSLFYGWDKEDFPSLVWLENDGQQQFTARQISHAPSNLATVDVGDLNHDGRADIIAGGMHVAGPLGRVGRLTVWLGQSPAPGVPAAGEEVSGNVNPTPQP